MKTVCEADALVEFYVRDLLDWKAGLERLGFMPHHDKTGHLSLFVKLYRSLAVEGRRRKVSHLGVTAKPVESGPWPGTQFTKSTVRLSFDFKFGYPLTFPRFTVGFKNLLGVYYTATYEIVMTIARCAVCSVGSRIPNSFLQASPSTTSIVYNTSFMSTYHGLKRTSAAEMEGIWKDVNKRCRKLGGFRVS